MTQDQSEGRGRRVIVGDESGGEQPCVILHAGPAGSHLPRQGDGLVDGPHMNGFAWNTPGDRVGRRLETPATPGAGLSRAARQGDGQGDEHGPVGKYTVS